MFREGEVPAPNHPTRSAKHAMQLFDQYPNVLPPVVVFLLAFFFAVHLTGVMRRVAAWLLLMDHPEARKSQTEAIPCAGGVAIVVAVIAALAVVAVLDRENTLVETPQMLAILAVGVGIAIVGLIDDIRGLHAVIKLLALAVGCLFLAYAGIGLNRTPSAVINYLMTFLWIAGVSSAFNAIDNSDGVAGSVCVISALMFFLLGWSTWQICFSFLAMAMAGSVLGFLHHNMTPARIYMGDTGSFFLGYILAVLVVYGEWSTSPTRSFFSGALVVAFPLFDLTVTSLLRIRHGIVRTPLAVLAYSDRDHLAHRLLRLGIGHHAMITICCAVTVLCCATAYAVIRAPGGWAWASLVATATLLGGLALFLDFQTSRPGLWTQVARVPEGGEPDL